MSKLLWATVLGFWLSGASMVCGQMVCFENVMEPVCPDRPLRCAEQTCKRPNPTWVSWSENGGILKPSFDWSRGCPANATETALESGRAEPNCIEKKTKAGMGYKNLDELRSKLCWTVRSCGKTCLETTQSEGEIENRWRLAGTSQWSPGTTLMYRAMCHEGSGLGDEDGPISEVWAPCSGPKVKCEEGS